jgi:hypothetical protein
MEWVYLATGNGRTSEALGEELAKAALAAPQNSSNQYAGRYIENARLAMAAILLTSSGKGRVTWGEADPEASWRGGAAPDMDAVVKLVKTYPKLALFLKLDATEAECDYGRRDEAHKEAAMLYRILDALNKEPEAEDEAERNAVFREVLWADGMAAADSQRLAVIEPFPREQKYIDILATGLARACTGDPREQEKAIARFKQLAASDSWYRVYVDRLARFGGPVEMFKMLSNPNFTSAAVENNMFTRRLGPDFSAIRAAEIAKPDIEPAPRNGQALRELIRSRVSEGADIAGLEREIRAVSKAMGGSEDAPIVGATSHYKDRTNGYLTESALFRVVVKDAQGKISERLVD